MVSVRLINDNGGTDLGVYDLGGMPRVGDHITLPDRYRPEDDADWTVTQVTWWPLDGARTVATLRVV